MSSTAVVVLTLARAGFVLDRILLACEARSWLNYRRKGLLRGGASYHSLSLQSIFDPGAENLRDARYEQVEERDDSGDPPPPASFTDD